MAPQEAPAAADVKEQQQLHPRPSSGSELTKENATAGIISNESLTVSEDLDVGCIAALLLSSSFLSLTISSSLIKIQKHN